MNIYYVKISDGSTTVGRYTAASKMHTAIGNAVEVAQRVDKLNVNAIADVSARMIHKNKTWKQFMDEQAK
jgi:predicted nucleic acid-binding protein